MSGDMGIYARLDYLGGAIRIFIEIRSAKVCETKLKTETPSLQDYTRYSGTVREQRNASHLVFKRTKCACRRRNT